jgi:hypothetical protein
MHPTDTLNEYVGPDPRDSQPLMAAAWGDSIEDGRDEGFVSTPHPPHETESNGDPPRDMLWGSDE